MNREALRLYLVTNRYQDSLESFLEKIETACRSGVTIVQLREKNLTTNQYYQLAKQVKEITDAYQVPLIIDDRLDVCLAVDAAGLHIGDDELPVSVARQVLGPEKILGVTAKTVKRALEAEEGGADYLGDRSHFPNNHQGKCTHHPDFNLEDNLPKGGHSSSCYRRLDFREH